LLNGTDLLQVLPVAIYVTDAEGRITFYNESAAELWGHRPELGADLWCGSWRLFWPDGRPMAHDECPMAVALREGRELRGVEALAERPDGTRVPFIPYPTLLRDGSGKVVGAINLLMDVAQRKHAEIESARLVAIVASSDDAIVSKTLEGQITSWNAGAAAIFGYSSEEMIGRSIKHIIPPELHGEEDTILAKIRRGEHVDHYETVRVTKDGRRVNISLTVSPIRDRMGNVIGASKVGRDVTERKRSEQLQRLLFDELNHRVKNSLATIQAIASQSLRRAASPADFVSSFNGRVQALARAHDLLVRREMRGADVGEIVREQVALGGSEATRISWSGPFVTLEAKTAVQLALVLHELATNARKYGALSVPGGHLSIAWDLQSNGGRQLLIEWTETGVPKVRVPDSRGFGTTLIERTLGAHGGEAVIRYSAEGIACSIRLPLPDALPQPLAAAPHLVEGEDLMSFSESDGSEFHGRRILLVEDEPLVAMDVEAQVIAEGYEVVGPAGTLEKARGLIAEEHLDAALLDANLGGHSVEELAAALTRKGIPFAFATGYGRDALPKAFAQAPVLTKPFAPQQLRVTLRHLLDRSGRRIVSIRRESL
jgi:PAS domain S-box-containing protein